MTKAFVRDAASARRIEERTKGSTTAIHSNIPAAKILLYSEFEEAEQLLCPICGWAGQASDRDREWYSEVFDVSCPDCEKMLLVICF